MECDERGTFSRSFLPAAKRSLTVGRGLGDLSQMTDTMTGGIVAKPEAGWSVTAGLRWR